MDYGPDVVAVLTADGSIQRIFGGGDGFFGFAPTEVTGRSLYGFLHPDDREQMQSSMECLLAEPSEPRSVVLRLMDKEGTYQDLHCTGRNLLGDPDVAGILIYSRDASEQVALARRLELAERLEAVGRMTSGIAHDFNNVLAVIELCAARALTGRGDRQQQLEKIRRAADRASGLTKRLLSFARSGAQPRAAVDICSVLRELADTLSSFLPETIHFGVSVPAEPRYVVADEAQVEQVVLNLVLNARDALHFEGEIHVGLTDVQPQAPNTEPQVVLSVQDDGAGMDEATQRLAFEPFFSTKSAKLGTGMGLWTVRDFAQRAGGTVRLQSVPQRGTRCEVILPTVGRPRRFRTLTPTPRPQTKIATVLLVEDEPALRETIAELLRDGGHRVVTARDGQQALELAEADQLAVDVLLTDVVLPRVGGLQLASSLRERMPDLAVLFMTGYSDVGRLPEVPRTAVLRKPFPAEVLMKALSRLLY